MAEPAERQATYEDVLRVPRHLVAEIVNGRLVTHPRPSPRHLRASSRLGVKLGDSFDIGDNGPGGWWILDEPELHLGTNVLVADLAGWRCERMPSLPDTAWFELPPDWICEVLSPRTASVDRSEKIGSRFCHAQCTKSGLMLSKGTRPCRIFFSAPLSF